MTNKITMVKDKTTKGAVRFVAKELENSNIYFKKSELAQLGMTEDTETITVTIEAGEGK